MGQRDIKCVKHSSLSLSGCTESLLGLLFHSFTLSWSCSQLIFIQPILYPFKKSSYFLFFSLYSPLLLFSAHGHFNCMTVKTRQHIIVQSSACCASQSSQPTLQMPKPSKHLLQVCDWLLMGDVTRTRGSPSADRKPVRKTCPACPSVCLSLVCC